MRLANTTLGTTIPFLALAGAMPGAQAATMNEYQECMLAPYVIFNSGSQSAAIGITSKQAGKLHWAFFDANGNNRADGDFDVGAGTFHGLIWANEAPANLANIPGFLLACLDHNGDGQINNDDGNSIAGNAFFFDIGAGDVAFLPTLFIGGDDAFLANHNPSNWDTNPIRDLGLGTSGFTGHPADVQYLIDGRSGGDDTTIIYWTTRAPGGTQSMTIFDGGANNLAITVPTPNNHLNLFDPESIAGLPGAFLGDGYISWTVPAPSGQFMSVFAFSIVDSPTFNAAQTLLGNFSR